MELSQVVEIALAGAGSHDVEVSSLEAADVSTEVVGSLAQIISELVQNAAAFSKPGQTVRLNGVFEDRDYLLTVSDDGVGIPEAMLDALNRVLTSPERIGEGPNLGISLVARLAARTGLDVQLVAGVPGTTARVTIPKRSVRGGGEFEDQLYESEDADPSPPIDLPRRPLAESSRPEHVVSVSAKMGTDVEAFLEKIFGPLRGRTERRDRPTRQAGNEGRASRDDEVVTRPPVEREPTPKPAASTLRVRVPGENFRVVDDEASIASSEAAIDLRVALDRYEDGRREAADEV